MYCQEQYAEQVVCGVKAAPGMTGPCRQRVHGYDGVDLRKLTAPPPAITCAAHAEIERAWRQLNTRDRDAYVYNLRDAGKSGRNRVPRAALEVRRAIPVNSNHCKSTWWASATVLEAVSASKTVKVRLTKKYAHGFLLLV